MHAIERSHQDMSTPRVKNDIPTYRRHRASGQAVVTLNGVDHYLGKFGSAESHAKYDQVINDWLARGRRPAGREDEPLLVKELIAGFWSDRSASLPEVERDKLRRALKPVRELFGDTKAADFGPVRFKAVRQKMVDDGLGIGTICGRLSAIRRMVAWGVENELLPGDALYKLQAVAGLRAGRDGVKPPKKVLPAADGDIDAILPYLSPTVRTMVELQRLTGMRPGEVRQMTTGQIDRTVDPWIYRPIQHKNKHRDKDRFVPLGPRAQEFLAPWLRADPDAPLFSPRESRQYFDAHRRHNGRSTEERRESWRRYSRKHQKKGRAEPRERPMYSTLSYGNSVAKACLRAGIPPFRPNQIRHSYATHVRHEYGLEAAQVFLGHSQADVTQIYAERDLAKAVEVAKKIG
jgi:integrase